MTEPIQAKKYALRHKKPIDLDELHNNLLAVVRIEIGHLQRESRRKPLDEPSREKLLKYLNLIKEMKQTEADGMSDSELEALANQGESK